jgi:hypothetical protein
LIFIKKLIFYHVPSVAKPEETQLVDIAKKIKIENLYIQRSVGYMSDFFLNI